MQKAVSLADWLTFWDIVFVRVEIITAHDVHWLQPAERLNTEQHQVDAQEDEHCVDDLHGFEAQSFLPQENQLEEGAKSVRDESACVHVLQLVANSFILNFFSSP